MSLVRSVTRSFLLSLALKINLYTIMGLHQEPNHIRINTEENSARLFMLEVYDTMRNDYEDKSHQKEPTRHYVALNSTLIPDVHETNGNDFIISFVNQASQLPLRGEKSDLLFYFNFSDVSSQVFVIAAELKLYKEPSRVSNESLYLIEVFRMERGKNTEDKNLEPEANLTVSEDYEGWLSIQIANTASYWNDYRSENLGLYVRVTDLKTGLNVDSAKAGIVGGYGPENQQPFMIGIFKMTDEEHVWPTLSAAREAQNVPPTEAKIDPYSSYRKSASQQRARQACRRQELYVDFASIGWNSWIIAPAGYNAFYCGGECNFPLADHVNPTLHATVQTIVHGSKPEIPNPCCAPATLSDIQLLYKDDNQNLVYKIYKGMVVDSCGCL